MIKCNCGPKSCLIVVILSLLVSGCSAASPKIPFQDDFEDSSSGWGAEQGDEFNRGYEEGEYFIELYQPNWFAWSYPGGQFDDVSVEADAYLSFGAEDVHFGVFCRYIDEDNFYYFSISADGYYGIFMRENGSDLKAITGGGAGMVQSSAIRTGGQTNTIQAVCQENHLRFYVNGELLEAVSDDAHSQGDVGLGAGSGPGGGARIVFDDLNVARP